MSTRGAGGGQQRDEQNPFRCHCEENTATPWSGQGGTRAWGQATAAMCGGPTRRRPQVTGNLGSSAGTWLPIILVPWPVPSLEQVL